MEDTHRAGTGCRDVGIQALQASQATAEVVNDEGIRDMRTAHWLAETHEVVEGAAGDAAAAALALAAVPWPQSAPRYQKY